MNKNRKSNPFPKPKSKITKMDNRYLDLVRKQREKSIG